MANNEIVGIGPRAVGLALDSVILSSVIGTPTVVILQVIVATSGIGGHSPARRSLTVMVGAALAALFFGFIYFVVSEALFGQTIGKRILGRKVCQVDRRPVSMRGAVLRNLLRVVDAFPFVIPYLVGTIVIYTAGERRNQRLGDIVAGTIVVSPSRARNRARRGADFDGEW